MTSPFSVPGAISWQELGTQNPKEAMNFYQKVFGWKFKTITLENGPYYIIENQGKEIGGISKNLCPDLPSHWTGYITVDDIDAIAFQVKSLGGEVIFGPQDIVEIGRFCWIKDPQGAVIAAISYFKPD